MWGFTRSLAWFFSRTNFDSCSYLQDRFLAQKSGSTGCWQRPVINTVTTRSNLKVSSATRGQQQQVSFKSPTPNASYSSTIAQEQDVTFDREHNLRIRVMADLPRHVSVASTNTSST